MRSAALRVVFVALGLSGCAHIPEPTAAMFGGDEAVAADLRKGRDLYIAKCSGCHGLYSVERYPDQEWAAQVDEMLRLDKVKLRAEEREKLVRYLTAMNGRD